MLTNIMARAAQHMDDGDDLGFDFQEDESSKHNPIYDPLSLDDNRFDDNDDDMEHGDEEGDMRDFETPGPSKYNNENGTFTPIDQAEMDAMRVPYNSDGDSAEFWDSLGGDGGAGIKEGVGVDHGNDGDHDGSGKHDDEMSGFKKYLGSLEDDVRPRNHSQHQ